MGFLRAVIEVAEHMIANPWPTIIVTTFLYSGAVLLWLAGGDHPLISAPPMFASYCLGVHIGLRIRGMK